MARWLLPAHVCPICPAKLKMADRSTIDGGRPLRILMVHNAYQRYGGEDTVVANEFAMLEGAGHSVELLQVSNDTIHGPMASARAALGTIYSWKGRALVADAIGRFRPDIMHVHNHFPLLSPSIFDASRDAGVASVWTLHNYRVTCANGLLFRDGKPCEECVGRLALPAIIHKCYRGSLAGSSAVASSITFHRLRGTWHNKVDRFVAVSAFARSELIKAGLPASRISVKPNFAPDPGFRGHAAGRAGMAYVGRLSIEKGVECLIDAWQEVDAPLTVIGDGPAMADLQGSAPAHVRFLGQLDRDETRRELSDKAAVVVPSICYESFGMVAIEAMAMGIPVIAARIGALPEIVSPSAGYTFMPGDAFDLARVVRAALNDSADLLNKGIGARDAYDQLYSEKSNLIMLENIYNSTILKKPYNVGAL